MSVYDFYRNKTKVNSYSTGNKRNTLGERMKYDSDVVMDATFENDLQCKVCYVYDYFHDDSPDLKDHMTYEHTTKTQIQAKFIIKTYQSLDRDQIEYYIQFRPSEKMQFSPKDELYYFETDYRNKYHNDDYIGMYCDIPDDMGVYKKWLICKKEVANQFVKFLVLPVNYQFMWIDKNGKDRIKRKMWGVLRNQNSYNSGLWTDRYFTTMENQQKIWLPLNSITERIWYTNDDSKNMRVLVSAFTDHPIAWKISKVENINIFGIQMITLYQDYFNQNTDYIERDSNNNIIGLWADYYDYEVNPLDQKEAEQIYQNISGKIIASTPSIKIGGSYKTLSLKLFNSHGEEITDKYSGDTFEWDCEINNNDEIDNLSDFIMWTNGKSFNQKKIKCLDNRSYLGKVLNVKCTVNGITYSENFELII